MVVDGGRGEIKGIGSAKKRLVVGVTAFARGESDGRSRKLSRAVREHRAGERL